MPTQFVARKYELSQLKRTLDKPHSSFVAVYGRSRIGKTETVLQFCRQNTLPFIEFTGRLDDSRKDQIKAFLSVIGETDTSFKNAKARNWAEAFGVLKRYLNTVDKTQKFVVFIDELPWLDTQKSGLIEELAAFWNRYADRRDNIILIVCGSTASYMVDKIIKNKGPLFGRLTDKLAMKPFNLHDTKLFLNSKGCTDYSLKSMCDAYMGVGGVATYLKSLDYSVSPEQALHRLCFEPNGILTQEYKQLYRSLFKNAVMHEQTMTILSQTWEGHTKLELGHKLKVTQRIVRIVLEDLIASGFITETRKLGNTVKESSYSATDFFSYFHNRWMSGPKKVSNWVTTANTQDCAKWSDYAFEKLCHLHVYQIKKALGLNGAPSTTHYWNYRSMLSFEKGIQINLLLRYEGTKNIDIIECKYDRGEFQISEKYKDELINKRNVLNQQTNSRYAIRLVIVTPFGVVRNQHFNELSPQIVMIEDLFEPDALR